MGIVAHLQPVEFLIFRHHAHGQFSLWWRVPDERGLAKPEVISFRLLTMFNMLNRLLKILSYWSLPLAGANPAQDKQEKGKQS
jgi:hypothetical protein